MGRDSQGKAEKERLRGRPCKGLLPSRLGFKEKLSGVLEADGEEVVGLRELRGT